MNPTERELLLQQGADIKELISVTSSIHEKVSHLEADNREKSVKEKTIITGIATVLASAVTILKDVLT